MTHAKKPFRIPTSQSKAWYFQTHERTYKGALMNKKAGRLLVLFVSMTAANLHTMDDGCYGWPPRKLQETPKDDRENKREKKLAKKQKLRDRDQRKKGKR